MKEQKKITLANLQQWVEDWVHNCELNHKDPSEFKKTRSGSFRIVCQQCGQKAQLKRKNK